MRASELQCPQAAQCERLCSQSMASMEGAPCAAEMRSATTCMLTHPAKDWECTPEGLAAIKEGFCSDEQETFANCVTKQVSP